MENDDLFSVLESLLGPAVAGMSSPAPRPQGTRTGGPATASAQTQPAAQSTGSVAALLSAETPVGMAVLDARSMRVRRANAALLSLFDQPKREAAATGHLLAEIAPGLAESEVDLAFRRVARTGQPFSAVIEVERAEGAVFLRCTLNPIRLADGTFRDLLLTLLDVTGPMEAQHRADLEIQKEIQSAEQWAQHVQEDELREAVRTAAQQALALGEDLNEALGRIARQLAESLGDCCALCVLGAHDVLELQALAHRDPPKGERLRAAYAARPLRKGEGIVGRVALDGKGTLVGAWRSEEIALVAGEDPATAADAAIASLVCVPLREAARSFGALLLYSTLPTVGGSGRVYGGPDLAFLQSMADQIAQAIQIARLREALRTTQAEQEAVLATSDEGIAIYDGQGHLRHLNAVGRQLLSRTVEPPARASMERGRTTNRLAPERTLLAPDGHQLEPEELPWTRALRGEQVGVDEPVPILLEWTGEARRSLRVRALPVRDGLGRVVGAVVTLVDVTPPAEPEGAVVDAGPDEAAQGEAPAGVTEWARWRETMELLDDGVMLCDATGAAVFVNAAGQALLGVATPAAEDWHVWEHVYQPDGAPLVPAETPVAQALAGAPVRDVETSVQLSDGTLRRVFWDARRIEGPDGEALGAVLLARPAEDSSPESAAAEPAEGAGPESPAAQPADEAPSEVPSPVAMPLAPTTLLPGRVVPEHEELASPMPESCDLAEACARVARTHGGAQGRRLEIRLPRKRVPVSANETLLDEALDALIASGAAALPSTAPLHVAVWVERAREGTGTGALSPVPPGVDIDQLNTVYLQNGQMPELAAPTRADAQGPQGAVAIVRICSPNMRASLVEPAEFVHCRQVVEQMGGRAWAREDPILGPTFSFSVPVVSNGG